MHYAQDTAKNTCTKTHYGSVFHGGTPKIIINTLWYPTYLNVYRPAAIVGSASQ
jgi:hypothetical protein